MASNATLLAYIDALETYVFDSEVICTLYRIQRLDRRLLAVRGYLRFMDVKHKNVWEHWAWSESKMQEWYASDAFKHASRLIDDINRSFKKANPGYHLYTKKEGRSVDFQLAKWDQNPQTSRCGEIVRSKLSAYIDREGLSSSPGAAEAQIVRSYIAKIDIGEKLLVATPGLSDHGHGNAFDTQVFGDDHKKMAGIGACWVSTWDGPHEWKKKLKDAVQKSGEGRFSGPLSSPYEPWHYEYDYS